MLRAIRVVTVLTLWCSLHAGWFGLAARGDYGFRTSGVNLKGKPSRVGGLQRLGQGSLPGGRPTMRIEGPAPRSAFERLQDPNIFPLLSSAGQRAMLIRSGMSIQRVEQATESKPQDDSPPVLDQIVNNPAFDTPTRYTQSETSICASGNNIVESFNDTSGDSDSGYAFSSDAGRTWVHRRIPQADNQRTLGDGVVTLGTNGEVYYATLMFTGDGRNVLSAVGVAKSADHGATFATPVDASTTDNSNTDFNDKEWIAVDRGASSPFKGNVYVAWTHFAKRLTIDFARSTDGGATFSAERAISMPGTDVFPQGSNIAVGPNGDVHIVYFDGGLFSLAGSIAYVKSTDGGRHFSPPVTIATMFPLSHVTGIGDVRANSLPNIAVGPDGNVHVVYGAQPALGGKDRSDIFYVRSTDRGSTFGQPVKLNDDNTDNSQLFPSVAITSGGAVGVEWWDRRNSSKDCLTDVYMTISHDGGSTFGPNFRVTRQNFVFTPIEPDLATAYHGDYLNMTADGEMFFPSWSSEARGNPDAYMATVPSDTDPLAPDFVLASQKVYDTISPGGSADYPINVKSIGGFSSDLTLAAFPQVPGLAVSFNRPGAGQSLSAHVQSSHDSPPGSYLIEVTAAAGGKTRATEFWVNILASEARIISPLSNVSNTPGYTHQAPLPQIDASGNIHVAFNDDTDSIGFGTRIFYSRSSDGGRTYSSPVQVSREGQGSLQPVIAIGPPGNVFIAWQYYKLEIVDGALGLTASAIAVVRSSDGGATFSGPVDITQAPAEVSSLVGLNADAQGGLQVLCLGVTGHGPPSLAQLLVVRSSDGGRSFTDPVAISGAGQQPDLASLVSDQKGRVLVTYCDGATLIKGSRTPVFACVSTDYGQSFSSPTQISPANVFVFLSAPIARLGADGSAYVLYQTYTAVPQPGNSNIIALSNPVLSLVVAPDGKTFAQAGQVAADSFEPSMLVSETGRVFVSFTGIQMLPSGGAGFTLLVARSEDKGASFSIPLPATNAPGSPCSGTMTLDRGGNLNAAWSDVGATPQFDIFVAASVDGGVTFSSPLNVSANVGSSDAPLLAAQADGSLAVFWHDDSAENPELFSAVLAPPPPAAPDFALITQSLTVSPGFSDRLVLSVSRPGGFSGNVTVMAPSTMPTGFTISPSTVSTTTTNAGFTLTVDKKHVKRGSRELQFTATDGSGRTKSATITVDIE